MKMRRLSLLIGCLLLALYLDMEYDFSYIDAPHLIVFIVYFISVIYFTYSWFYVISGLLLGISIVGSLIFGMINDPDMVRIVFDSILALGLIIFYSFSIYRKLTHRQQHQTVIDEEISKGTLSGSGTMSDPYLLDFQLAPSIQEYIIEKHEKIIYALHGGSKEYGTSRYGFFDGILVGQKHADQIHGGFWIHEENQHKITNEEPIWINGVVYLPFEDVQNIYTLVQDDSYKITKNMKKQLAYASYDESYRMLKDSHIDEVIVLSLLKALGKKQRVFSKAIQEELIHKIWLMETYQDMMTNEEGMIYGSYQILVENHWIQYASVDSWVLFPTLYEPSSYYGQGIYQSYS